MEKKTAFDLALQLKYATEKKYDLIADLAVAEKKITDTTAELKKRCEDLKIEPGRYFYSDGALVITKAAGAYGFEWVAGRKNLSDIKQLEESSADKCAPAELGS